MTNYWKDQKKVLQLWNKYVLNDNIIPKCVNGLRDEIRESWQRSKQHSVDPLNIVHNVTPSQTISVIINKKRDLISVAHSYMEMLYSFIKGSNYDVVLSDEFGNIIDIIGKDDLIRERTQYSKLEIGTNRSEEIAGTNGIGTCLYLKKPIQVFGAEHYIKPHHMYVCSAAPIFDEEKNLIGCLDIVGPEETIHPHTLGMVCAAVDGIEKSMKMKRAYDKISIMNKQLQATIHAINSGVLVIDKDGYITQYNKSVINMLKLNKVNLIGRNIKEIFINDISLIDILFSDEPFSKKEVSLTTKDGYTGYLLMSSHIINNKFGEKESTVFVIEEIHKVHKMVSKMSGFTANFTFDSIIGDSKAIKDIKTLGLIASQSDSNVLIIGESGTGKELVAQSIHNASSRRNGPFIAINCGSIPKGLIESELFGYEGGSFTGAKREGQPGKFELAEGGTIFLDEIGDMPLDLQGSLLRVIQTKEIVRIGGKRAKAVNVRIMAATHVNLADRICNGNFRSDLYYRLNVLSIVLPPLRKRKNDILPLVNHFIQNYNKAIGKNVKGLTFKANEMLHSYDWPGNVRELENVIERAINLTQGDLISENELSYDILSHGRKDLDMFQKKRLDLLPVENIEYQLIIEALEEYKGNVNKVAASIGIPRRTLYRRFVKYQIDVDIYRE